MQHHVQNKLRTDAGFWGAVCPVNADDPVALRGMLQAGALGFKAFLSPSGAGFRHALDAGQCPGLHAIGLPASAGPVCRFCLAYACVSLELLVSGPSALHTHMLGRCCRV